MEITFDELGNIYVDEGGITQLGKNRPCFQAASILFKAGDNDHNAQAGMGFVTSARATSTSSFFVDMVEEVFGIKHVVTEGYPTMPPLHGRPYNPEAKTHILGNSWIDYKEENNHIMKQIQFRSLGDGAIVEVQMLIRRK